MRILVIGNSTRGVVCSAKKAGYTVYALDRFGDVDMRKCADKYGFFEGMPERRLYELASAFGEVDSVVLMPGFEKLRFKNVLNNRLQVLEEVNDKLKIAENFSKMDIPHPETRSLNKASELGFPLMIKPRFGSGGIQNSVLRDEDDLSSFMERSNTEEFIAQEFVEGIPCSASLIGNGDEAVIVALNEQLIGIPWLTRLPFAYCGNITPFNSKFNNEMIQYATRIALEFRLLGSNGVDFMLTEKGVSVLEVNPRFQGSIDTVELSMGINIFDAHVKSFSGELPERGKPVCFAAKAIVYANRNIVINEKISGTLARCMEKGRASDIPQAGWIVRPDEPVVTVLETGKTREIVLEKIGTSSRKIKEITEA
ncbi:MAG: ATP-grasp domain-containing protein [Candidatus Methanoperedens sp.]|nr:ATP-grasp domain-containing protein [Candidatus Methanoperedens sp.]MCZ7371285.1 ATP-grasp domain-containing protein [Candidatus Methanoperedens sp.]